MTPFEMVALAVSFILGFGITHLLSSSLLAFRTRRQYRLHWMPAIWAFCVFVLQLQFWWSMFGLAPFVEAWTPARFGLLLVCALTLFAAGALVLPDRRAESGHDVLSYFAADGRWSLVALGAYHIEALALNATLFRSAVRGRFDAAPIWIGLALVISMLIIKRRAVQAAITAAFLATVLAAVVVMSTPAYR